MPEPSRRAEGVGFVSCTRVDAELDLDDTVGHAVNASWIRSMDVRWRTVIDTGAEWLERH
ncbi:hypothetical protein [Agromyces arachidis]|uniref:hypothetical protein n=1 Tax=Agromyces arachidis TaxID=766966 RepID=UPI0040563A3D